MKIGSLDENSKNNLNRDNLKGQGTQLRQTIGSAFGIFTILNIIFTIADLLPYILTIIPYLLGKMYLFSSGTLFKGVLGHK